MSACDSQRLRARMAKRRTEKIMECDIRNPCHPGLGSAPGNQHEIGNAIPKERKTKAVFENFFPCVHVSLA